MNKKLLALAIAGAFVAPVAMADTSNVTIYGTLGLSIDSVDGGTPYTGAQTDANTFPNAGNSTAASGLRLTRREGNESVNAGDKRGRVSSNNSFIGFKGTEDLGNGLSAIWQYEFTVAFDRQTINNEATSDVNGVQSKRNTFAGLSSKTMGTLTFGLQDTPLKTSTGKLDQFGNTVADYRTFIGGMGGSVRAENSVMYTSPNMSGFTAKALYGFKNEGGNGDRSNPSIWSASGTYENGPILAVLAYENNKEVQTINPAFGGGGIAGEATVFGVGLVDVPFTTGAAVSAGNLEAKMKTMRAGFGYNFGVAKLGAAYERSKLNGSLTSNWENTASTALTTQSLDLKRNTWYLSGSFNVTPKTAIKAAYTRAGKLTGASCTDCGNTSAKQWAVGVDHAMSKRTSMYALYTTVQNSKEAAYSLAGGATGIAGVSAADAGSDPRAISVGMRHSF